MNIKKKLKLLRSKIIKRRVIGNISYVVVFGKFRIPYTKSGQYLRLGGLEIKRGRRSEEDELLNPAGTFSFEKTEAILAYAMEEKITTDIKKHYCEQKGYKQLKYFPNLTKPQTFNEKLLWLAVYYKNSDYSVACDKAAAKDWIGKRVGAEYTVPVIGVYDDVNAMDFDSFPEKFVMKANNGWGSNEVALIRDKSKCDIENLKAIASTWLYPWKFYCYNNMCITDEKPSRPLIVVEEFLEQKGKKYPDDYKLYCCNGKVKFSMIVSSRGNKNQSRTFVDREWNPLPVGRAGKQSAALPTKPAIYEKMVELAERLAVGTPLVRVDFYDIDGKLYVGELTFTPGLFLRFDSKGEDEFLGNYLDISGLMGQVDAI